MKNWKIAKYNWYISWYNIKNEPIDEYPQKYNKVYQNNPKKYFKKIFKISYKRDYGFEFVHEWNRSHLLWTTPKNIYWCIFRYSTHVYTKAHWTWKLMCTRNTGDCCG